MVSLWPSTASEAAAAETANSGSIEMKGSNRVGTARPSSKAPTLWPSSSFRSKPRTQQTEIQPDNEIQPDSESRTADGVQLEHSFLDAIVRANTPTVLSCTPSGAHILPRCPELHKVDHPGGSITVSVSEAESDSAEIQDFHEVQLTLRVPRATQRQQSPPEGKSYDELIQGLQVKERQRKQATDALATKNQECEDLLRIVRELTESRNKLAGFRAIQAERLADLQHEYRRVMRVADLSRAVSKENLGKTAQATQRLNQVEEELARQKLINQQTKERYARLKLDNLELREKICLLERLDLFAYRHESACMVEFKHYHLKETY